MAENGLPRDALWDSILKQHVSSDGWIDYRGLRKKSLNTLNKYIASMSLTRLKLLKTSEIKKAFWINAYNAIVIKKIINRGIPGKVPLKNFFKEKTYKIAGKQISLDEIEHSILRIKYKDPRIHAALVCGASTCPRLRNEVFNSETLDEQLNEEVINWLNSGKDLKGNRKNFLDKKKKTYFASKIFSWYIVDFKSSNKGVLEFITRFVPENDRKFIERNNIKLRFLNYDWRVNKN